MFIIDDLEIITLSQRERERERSLAEWSFVKLLPKKKEITIRLTILLTAFEVVIKTVRRHLSIFGTYLKQKITVNKIFSNL